MRIKWLGRGNLSQVMCYICYISFYFILNLHIFLELCPAWGYRIYLGIDTYMGILSSFTSFLQRKQLIAAGPTVTLLAVSGGVDSVVLCHLFHQTGLPFSIAHCNFQLRGQAAEADMQFVSGLAQRYQVAFHGTHFETQQFASQKKISIQMAARILRYQFFDQLLNQYDLPQLATAHHWDDSVETMIFNFVRGTGIKGLCGIEPRNGKIIRPLLFARKNQIITYAHQQSLTWREDGSNRETHYQRNFIRHKIIPLMHQINPNFEETAKISCEKFTDVSHIFQCHVNQTQHQIHRLKGDIHHISISRIAHLPAAATLAFELVAVYGFTFKQIKRLLTHPPANGKVIYAMEYALYIDRSEWLIQKRQPGSHSLEPKLIFDHTTTIQDGAHTLHFRMHRQDGYCLSKATTIAALRYDRLHFPLTLRTWKPGDILHPIGMKGRKKVSDLLIDLKVPMALKSKIRVVTSQGQIVWVVGYRIDEQFKIDAATQTIWEMQRTDS